MKWNVKEMLKDTHQLTRITILTGVVLFLAMASFAGYYYYDRYYTSQATVKQITLAQAEQAVRDDPQSSNKRMVLAESYLFFKRYADALTQAGQVAQKEPDNQRVWLVVGVASALGGKPADAIDPLTKLVNARKDEEMAALDKSLTSAAYYLGDSYLQLGKPQEAIGPLELAAGWTPTDSDTLYELGLAYSGVKDYAKAALVFQAATTFVPDYLEAYQGMCAAYTELKQAELVNYCQGMIAYSKKDFKTALPLLLQAAQAQPGFMPVFIGLGRNYEGLNDFQNAKLSYELALKLDPANFTASNGLQRVDLALKK